MDARKLSDLEIKRGVDNHFTVRFWNFSGDHLMECLETDAGIQGSEADYHRACQLMDGARLIIEWPDEMET